MTGRGGNPGGNKGGGANVAGAATKAGILGPSTKNFKVAKNPGGKGQGQGGKGQGGKGQGGKGQGQGGKGQGGNPPGNQPNPPGNQMKGPVNLRVPAHYTQAERAQFQEYAQGANNAIKNGHMSPSGKVPSGKGTRLRKDADNAAAKERKRAAKTNNPYQKGDVAAHLPDATWLGRGEPPAWGHHTSRVNTAISNQQKKYPPGFEPTQFNVT